MWMTNIEPRYVLRDPASPANPIPVLPPAILWSRVRLGGVPRPVRPAIRAGEPIITAALFDNDHMRVRDRLATSGGRNPP